MTPTNKLIEAIADMLPEAVVEMIDRAGEFGDCEFIDQVAEAMNRDGTFLVVRVDDATDLQKRLAELDRALAESVRLQSHYAKLLNMHDGGHRLTFEDSEAWLARLREVDAAQLEQAQQMQAHPAEKA